MNNLKIMRFLLHTYHFGQNILQETDFRIFLSCNNPILQQDVPLAMLCCRETARGRCLGCPSRWLSQDYSNRNTWGTQNFKFSGTETMFLSKHCKWLWGLCFQVGAQLALHGCHLVVKAEATGVEDVPGAQCGKNIQTSWFMHVWMLILFSLID